MSYVAAGALFTALAFCVTFLTLKSQQKSLLEQREDILTKTTLEVFTSTFKEILNEERFLKSKEYIFSPDFFKHLANLKKIKKDLPVTIEHFKNVVKSQSGKNSKQTQNSRVYEKITYFCSKMEYLGVIVKNEYVDETIIDYFGKTIVESYKRLGGLIENHREATGDCSYYIYYTRLYDTAKKREKDFIAECKTYLTETRQSSS